MYYLTVAGVQLELEQAHDVDEDIESIAGASLQRTINGTAIMQVFWTGKRVLSLSAYGWQLAPLAGIDITQEVTVTTLTGETITGFIEPGSFKRGFSEASTSPRRFTFRVLES